jgi:hypothetical protein
MWLGLFQWMNSAAYYDLFQNSTRIIGYFEEPIVQEVPISQRIGVAKGGL